MVPDPVPGSATRRAFGVLGDLIERRMIRLRRDDRMRERLHRARRGLPFPALSARRDVPGDPSHILPRGVMFAKTAQIFRGDVLFHVQPERLQVSGLITISPSDGRVVPSPLCVN